MSKTTKKYFYIKLFEDRTECSYSGYSKKKVLCSVDSKGNITNLESFRFATIPADTELIITHIGVSDKEQTYTVYRNLVKRIKTNSSSQIPKFNKGDIKTNITQPIRERTTNIL